MNAAYLFGINNYRFATELTGCLADVAKIKNRLIKRHRFQPQEVKSFLDEKAVKHKITDALWMMTQARSNDELVFLFSGHGKYKTDFGGEEHDGRNECIVPFDYDGTDRSLLPDQEMAEIIRHIPRDANATFIFACCFSGDITSYGSSTIHQGKFLKIDPGMNHLLISACRSDQKSSDASFGIDPVEYDDAFIYYLCQALDDHPGETWIQIIEHVNILLAGNGYSQVAQLEGPAHRMHGYPFGGIQQ